MEEQRQDEQPQDEAKPDEKMEDLPVGEEEAEDVQGGRGGYRPQETMTTQTGD